MIRKYFFVFIIFALFSAKLIAQIDTTQNVFEEEKAVKNPKVAMILSGVLPGSGQIYNGKIWKVPIIYGLFTPLAYMFNSFNHDYKVYKFYLTLADRDSITNSLYFTEPIYLNTTPEQLLSTFDNTRRKRDLTVFAFALIWTLNVVDAYVDAELSNFDVSEDLSMQIYPSVNYCMGNQYLAFNFKFYF
ncbi:MAG: hypothetical protein JXL97_03910 [Bacteroidales bacterium]|nr:hypothetical protein [Bacteroidales bacterium]